jgi:hypothetical protein
MWPSVTSAIWRTRCSRDERSKSRISAHSGA